MATVLRAPVSTCGRLARSVSSASSIVPKAVKGVQFGKGKPASLRDCRRSIAAHLPRTTCSRSRACVSSSNVRVLHGMKPSAVVSVTPPRTRLLSTSHSPGRLTDSSVKSFRENGFLVIDEFASPSELKQMQDSALQTCAEFATSDKVKNPTVFSTVEQERTSDDYFLTSGDHVRCFFEEGAFDDNGKVRQDLPMSKLINKIGHAMHELDPAFWRFCNSPKMKDLCDSLEFEDPRLPQTMYIFKQERIGGAVLPHQDSTFLHTAPLSTVGVWLAIEDATLDNGCLWAVPGSHKKGIKRRFIRNPKTGGPATVFEPPEPEEFDLTGGVPVPVKAGGVVLLDGALVHYSEKNTSPHSRHAFTLHIIEGGKGHAYDKFNWLQRGNGEPFMKITGRASGDKIVVER